MKIIDTIVGLFRSSARATMAQVNALVGTTTGPYAAANTSRLNRLMKVVQKENEVSGTRLDVLRAQSWDLYRDNPSCRKIVRSLESKVIGKGMHPESLATNSDGTPNTGFRELSMTLWESLQSGFDSRGMPGKGGLTMGCQQRLALRSAILSGDTLYRIKPISQMEQERRNLPVAIVLQLVDSCRLASDSEIESGTIEQGNFLFRGIEYNANSERVAYWIKNVSIAESAVTSAKATRIAVEKMGHLFIEEDIDQSRGVPWFSSAILRARRTDDLEYNVLTASAMASCVVAKYSKPTGAPKLGLNSNTTGDDLTDSDGNTVSKIQPGMVVNTGKDGSFDLMSPNQPNMNPEAFVQHLQRGTATAMPGTKGSTVTGDYRNSSFSSERSADNDCWPEIQILQEWFASQYCQPVWETILRTAILEGYFDGVVSMEEFQADPNRFSAAAWQGPVALSINPKDDAAAAAARVRGGLSSLQMECAKVNVNWRDVLNDIAELYETAKEKNIPPEVIANMMGIDPSVQAAAMAPDPADTLDPADTEDTADTEDPTVPDPAEDVVNA
jgi:lambda family phage portal protein